MSALTKEQVDVALALRELAGEQVPLSPGARELWVRYGMSVGMTGRQIQDAVDRIHGGDEDSESRESPLWTMPNELVELRDVTASQGEILEYLRKPRFVNFEAEQMDGYDQFYLQMSPNLYDPKGLTVTLRHFPGRLPRLYSLIFETSSGSVGVHQLAFDELAHLLDPLVRRAISMASQVLPLLELDLS